MGEQDSMFPGPAHSDIRMLDMIAEVDRELGYRRHVYARLVKERRMTQSESDKRQLVMQAIRAKLYGCLIDETPRNPAIESLKGALQEGQG